MKLKNPKKKGEKLTITKEKERNREAKEILLR